MEMDLKKVGNLLREICEINEIDISELAKVLKMNKVEMNEVFLGNKALDDYSIKIISEIFKYDVEEFKKGNSILQNRAKSYEEAVLGGKKALEQFYHYCHVIQGNFSGKDYRNKTIQDYVIDFKSKECLEFLIDLNILDFSKRTDDLIFLFLKFGMEKELTKVGFFEYRKNISKETLLNQLSIVADANYAFAEIKNKIETNHFLAEIYLLALAKSGNKDATLKQIEFMLTANESMDTIIKTNSYQVREQDGRIYKLEYYNNSILFNHPYCQFDSTIYNYVIKNQDIKSLELLLKANVQNNLQNIFDFIIENNQFWAISYFEFDRNKEIIKRICLLDEAVIKKHFSIFLLPITNLIKTKKYQMAIEYYKNQKDIVNKIYAEIKDLDFRRVEDFKTPYCDSILKNWRARMPVNYQFYHDNKIETFARFLRSLGWAYDSSDFGFTIETALESKNSELIKIKMKEMKFYEKDRVLNDYTEGDLNIIKTMLDAGACFLIKGHSEEPILNWQGTEEEYTKQKRNMTKTNLMKLQLQDY